MLSRITFIAALFAGAAATVAAAPPAPTIANLSHPWVTRGQTVELIVNGDNLADVSRVIIDGDKGLAAEIVPSDATPNPKQARVKLTIAADAPLSERELRLVSPGGVSNKLDVNVTFLPVIAEREGNNTSQQAQPVELPATITGVINGGADLDHFKFTATKGQQLVFEVFAQRMGSALDSSLKLYDSTGRMIARSEDAIGTDSLIACEIPADGEYSIVIHDVQYRGGGNYNYRINAGAIPYAHAIFPRGGQKGTQVDVKLHGWNLPSPTLRLDLSAKAVGTTTIFATPDGASNPLVFEVSDLPELIESEPNADHTKANAVSALPVIINGVIGQPGDVDFFRFKVEQPAKLRLDVDAARFGSPLDALLSVHNAGGAVMQSNDDAVGSGADAMIERDFAPGEYIVSVTDLTSLGGADFAYRLSIAPPKPAMPDFSVRYSPDVIRLHRGGRTLVQCEVIRSNGFNGAVTVALKDAPKGVMAQPLVLENGPVSGVFIIESAADADLTSASLKIIATGEQGAVKIERMAQPLVRVDPVKRGYVTVLEAAPFAVNLPKPLTEAQVQEVMAQIKAIESRLLAPHAELDAAQPAWEAKVLETVKGNVALSPWHHIGPFGAGSFDEAHDKAFEPEKQVDLKKPVGQLKWEAKPQWTDGAVYNEFTGDNSANYIYRTIDVAADRTLDLSLGSDDAIKVFYNGKLVLENKIGRGAAPDQEKVTLALKAGTNHLLIKVINGSGPSGFYFKASADTHGVPADVVAALQASTDKRTAEQKATVQHYYRTTAPQLTPLRAELAALRQRIGPREEIVRLKAMLNENLPQLAAAQAKWEQGGASAGAWIPLELGEMKSTGGAAFARQADGSILLSGASQPKDTYTLAASTDVRAITAIRLEALSDKSLPAGGPGRALNGNFVLTQFNLTAAPKGDPSKQSPVVLHSPTATFAQDSWPIVNTLDANDGTGWAVSPRFNESHTALFLLKEPLTVEGGALLSFTLANESVHVQHTLGRFRISVTTSPKPGFADPTIPTAIRSILDTPTDKRNPKQAEELAAYYRSIAPELNEVRGRLEALEAAGNTVAPTMKYNQSAKLAVDVSRAGGFMGDITVTAIGFATGRDPAGNFNVITKDLEVTPLVLKGEQTSGVLTLKAKDKSEFGTRSLVLQAEAMVDGQKVVTFSEATAVTIQK
ncbi:MAG: PPC domain-containing protein [Phycisphaeraceae bacterium]